MTIWSNAVTCSEVHNTRNETRNINGGPGASVQLECAYADKDALAADLMSNSDWPFTAAGKSAPKVQNISINVQPEFYTADEQAIAYTTALLTVNYGFDNSSGSSSSGGGSGTGRQRYTESFEPELEVISLQDREYYYREIGGAEVPLGKKNIPHFREYTFSITRTYYNWVSVPLSFKDLLGYVNNADVTFPTLGLTFNSGDLLFVPQNAVRTISSEGTAGFTVSVKFKYQRGGWNEFPVGEAGERKTIFYKDDAGLQKQVTPHPDGDFSGWIF